MSGACFNGRRSNADAKEKTMLFRSVELAVLFGRKERGVEDVAALRLGVLELVRQRDLVDRLVEAVVVDGTEAVLLYFRRNDVVLQRDLQALELDLFLGDVVSLEHRFDRGRGVLDRLVQSLGEGAQERLHGLRLLGGELR